MNSRWILTLILIGALGIVGGNADSSGSRAPFQEDSYQTWEMTPMIVASEGETLFVMTTAPLPAYHEIVSDTQTTRLPLWNAIGGRIIYANERWVVYRAPRMEGVYLVYWQSADRSQRFGFLVRVKSNPTGDETVPMRELDGYIGGYVPLTNGSEAPVALFLARKHTTKPGVTAPPNFMDGEGNIEIDLPLRPLLSRPNRPCRGNRPTNESVQVEDSRWRVEAGTIAITASLAAQLRDLLGIEVSIGSTINVYAEWRRVARFRIVDCYRCENGSWRWVGTRVEYEICTYLEGYIPPWICRAVDLGILDQFICPKEPLYEKKCVSIGECPCPPPTPILTRPGHSPCSKMTGE